MTWIRITNKLPLRRSALGDVGAPIVSLTSYGDRVAMTHFAIESILRGKLRPSRIILWVDDQKTVDFLPRQLKRLRQAGLEVRVADGGSGPHTKYFDALALALADGVPLVTADDDTVYPADWLHRLFAYYLGHPDGVACYRARRVVIDTSDRDSGPRLTPYSQWPLIKDSSVSNRNFVTGVSGALYPAELMRALVARGTQFEELCPKADDVWINHTALQAQIPIRVVDGRSRDFISLESTQAIGLKHANVMQGGNDAQIAATYSELDRKRLAGSS
ncbi:glycosyltransferase family A protein [Gordonia sp. KTR9]|uniref:glycosyltransferase family A protein n=1 Tax=Gordonia sp. KTR9 TaxID=337191 RepID=UPI001EE67194|nr:glycosyltransferase family A protein [Gordonia sp. KTR9]